MNNSEDLNRLSNRPCQILGRIVIGTLSILLLDLPVTDSWKMFTLLLCILALIHGSIRISKSRFLWSASTVALIFFVKSFLPSADIREGHNMFLSLNEGETLQRLLPAVIFKDWKREFNTIYPPAAPPYEEYTWRHMASKGILPDRLYTYSSDALWHPAKYSRTVKSISFKNIGEYRGGFFNELKYGTLWFRGIPDRRKMPFFVFYEFSEQSVGCTLNWRGSAFWERGKNVFEKINHSDLVGRTITREDINRKVYFFFLPDRESVFPVSLELSGVLAASRLLGVILSVIGILVLFIMMVRIRWRSFFTAAFITTVALALVYTGIVLSGGKPLGALYTPHGGGDDGVSHESWGRDMARLVFQGEFKEAFRGFEDVYNNTPGMRYARAVERIIFGDTNLGLTALLSCLPWFFHLLLSRICSFRWACIGTSIFFLSPISFSFSQYIFWGMLGYAEPIASGLFLIGLFLFLKCQPRWNGDGDLWYAFIGGACLAASVFLRPNHAIAMALTGLAFCYTSWRDKKYELLIVAVAGLGLVLFIPLHNLYYGREFYLISKAGATISVTLTPETYLRALEELFSANWRGANLLQTITQIRGWLWTPPVPQFPMHAGINLFLGIRLMTLFVTLCAIFVPSRRIPHIALLAWVAITAHVPMLFVFETKLRYGVLAWDLSGLVTLIFLYYAFRDFLVSNKLSAFLGLTKKYREAPIEEDQGKNSCVVLPVS